MSESSIERQGAANDARSRTPLYVLAFVAVLGFALNAYWWLRGAGGWDGMLIPASILLLCASLFAAQGSPPRRLLLAGSFLLLAGAIAALFF